MSGTTLGAVLLYGNQLFVGNVGDSRIILVSKKEYSKKKLN